MSKIIWAGVFTFLTTTTAFAAKYTLDGAHSNVQFKIKHMMLSKVKGGFKKFDGSFDFDEKTGKIKDVSVKIDIDSIDTADEKRDGHLKTEDFFGYKFKDGKIHEENRYITFKSTESKEKGGKPDSVVGDLSLHGKTQKVTLKLVYNGKALDMQKKEKVGFEASTTIKRSQFDISKDTPAAMVGDEIEISIDGEATKE